MVDNRQNIHFHFRLSSSCIPLILRIAYNDDRKVLVALAPRLIRVGNLARATCAGVLML
jgi:UV DNA damage repair endonuclease